MKFSFVSLITKFTLATSVAGALVGCDDPTYPTPTPVTESSVGRTQVLVVNAAPGSQGITTTFENQPFGVLTPYLGSPVSTYTSANAGLRLFVFDEPLNIPANPANFPTVGTPPVAAPPVNTSPIPLLSRASYAGGLNYTVFLTDPPRRAFIFPVTPTSDRGGIRTLTLLDNLAAPTVATNAKIRLVNLSPSGTYGIFNTTTVAAGVSLFTAAPFRAYRGLTSGTGSALVTFADFTEVAAGSYTLDARSAATTALTGTRLPVTLAAGKIYTLYVRGIAGNTTTPLGISVVTHN